MKKYISLSLALVAVASLAVACSGGGGGGGAKTLSTGTYTLSASAIPVDDCGFGSNYYANGDTVDVTVTGTTIDMDFVDAGFQVDYELTGTTLLDADETPTTFDFSVLAVASANGLSRTYACVHTRDQTYTGEVTAKDTFTLDDTYENSNSGAECAAVVTSLGGLADPCISTLVTTATK